jgi:aminopeptidase N
MNSRIFSQKRLYILLFSIITITLPLYNSTEKSTELMKFYQSEQQMWKDSNIDVMFYYLDIVVNVPYPYLQGHVLCQFRVTEPETDSIQFNLHHTFSVDSITGNIESFIHLDGVLVIKLNSSYSVGDVAAVKIYYQGVPELAGGIKGLHYSTHGQNEPIIASLSTPFLAHYWWPCKDGPGDKADSVYLDITIPDSMVNGIPLMAVSNGILENIITQNSSRTFQWRHRYPIVPYYVMVAISNYRHFQQLYKANTSEAFPIDYYVFDHHLSEASQGVTRLSEVIELFSTLFGSYPFQKEKYGMTQIGFYGAIENQTNTIQNNLSAEWFGVSVHELAHMWFGDMITCEDWHHGWLNEGFATYCEALWYEHLEGFEAYRYVMGGNEYYEGGTLYLQDISDPFDIFIRIIYRKGSYTLHMLRGVLGDSLFFQCLKSYASAAEFRFGHANTSDFQSTCENISGMDLDFFFDQWIYDHYFPIYQFGYWQNSSTLSTTILLE